MTQLCVQSELTQLADLGAITDVLIARCKRDLLPRKTGLYDFEVT